MLSLTSVMLGSEDPKGLVAFYTKVLGDPAWSEGDFVGWQTGAAGLMIGPHSDVKGRSDMPARVIWNFDTDDIDEDFARIRDLGATVIQEPYHPGEQADMTMATFEDPDGNYFQINTPYTE